MGASFVQHILISRLRGKPKVADIASGLEYLHRHKLCHGDLRGDNVLIDDKLQALLTDFGLTTLAGSATFT